MSLASRCAQDYCVTRARIRMAQEAGAGLWARATGQAGAGDREVRPGGAGCLYDGVAATGPQGPRGLVVSGPAGPTGCYPPDR